MRKVLHGWVGKGEWAAGFPCYGELTIQPQKGVKDDWLGDEVPLFDGDWPPVRVTVTLDEPVKSRAKSNREG